uniref:Uncharacterized protein n=1 Tax=Meloidogyne incognita TaxID=6306 RepID=A0A914N772_MELIC
MPLFDVLLPKMLFLEQFGTFWNSASEFVVIFLLHEFDQLFLQSFFSWLSTQFSHIHIVRIQNLHNLILKRSDPIESALKLLFCFGNIVSGINFALTIRRRGIHIHLVLNFDLSWEYIS